MSEIEKLPQVKKLSEFLDNMNNNKESEIKIRKIVSDYLNTLFYSYADLKAFPAFDQKEFDQSYKLLEDYMYGTLVCVCVCIDIIKYLLECIGTIRA